MVLIDDVIGELLMVLPVLRELVEEEGGVEEEIELEGAVVVMPEHA